MPNGGLRQVLAWSRGPPHVSHTSGPSITKHWRTTPIRRRLSSPQTTIILHWPPPRPPPPAHLPHHGSEALSAHPLHENDGSGAAPLNHSPDGGPCHHHHPTMRPRRWTRTPSRHRTGTGPSSHDYHRLPFGRGPRLTSPPHCPRAQEDILWNPGLASIAQRGWATVFMFCVLFFFMCLTRNKCL